MATSTRCTRWAVRALAVGCLTIGAVTVPVSASANPPGTRVADSFDRPNSSSLGVADSGQAWSGWHGSFGVQGGAAGVGSGGYSLAVVDSGGGNGVVSARVTATASEFWLVLRGSDGSNYWRFGRWNDGPYQLQQIANNGLGSPTVTNLATVTAAVGDLVSCRLNGTLISCNVNGTAVLSANDGFNQTASRVGFATYQGSPSPVRFDDLLVTDIPVAPDLSVTLTDDDPVFVGGALKWTATVTNQGTAPANAVTVTAPLPSGAIAVAAATTTGSCTTTAGLACQLGALAAGQTATITLTGTAPAAATTLTLAVTATTTGDANPANNTATQTTTVKPAPAPGTRVVDSFDRPNSSSLGVADSGQAWSGWHGSFGVQGGAAGVGSGGYSLAVVDSGGGNGVVSARVTATASEFWLVLRGSDGSNYWRFGRWNDGPYQLQQIANNGLGSPTVTNLATVTAAVGDLVSCRLNGTLISCNVNGTAVLSANDGFNQTASRVGFATYQGSPSPVRFDDLLVTDIPVAPDLSVTLTDDDPVFVGGALKWTATVTNQGTAPANAVTVTAPLPSGAIAVAAATTTGSCTTTAGLACQLGALAAGQTATITLTGTAPAAATTLTLAVTATTTGDANPANNTATQTTTVKPAPAPGTRVVDSFDRPNSSSLGVADSGQAWSGWHGSFGVQGGAAGVGSGGYSLAVVDSGGGNGVVSARVTATASEFWLVLRGSDGSNYWRFGRWNDGPYQLQQIANNGLGSPTVTNLATVTAAVGDLVSCRLNGTLISCNVNGTAVLSANDGFNQTASRVGFATYQGSPSPVRFDDLLVADIPVAPDLSVAVTDDDPVFVGGALKWTATVTNQGTAPANAVTVTAPLPSGAIAVAAATTTGSCTTTTGLNCQLGALAAGQTATITLTGTAPAAATTLTLAVTATTTGDANPANNTATQTTTVRTPPAPGTRITDYFDRPDSSSLGVADTGQTWSFHGGGFGITGGAAAPASSGASIATVDAGFAFGTYLIRVDETGDGRFWAVFRYLDSNNYYRVGPDPSTGHYRVEKVVNGQVTGPQIQIVRTSTAAADGDLIRVITRPDDGFFVSVNGTHIIDGGDVDLMHATGFGVRTTSNLPRFGFIDVGQLMTASSVVLDTFNRPDGTVIGAPDTGVKYRWMISPWVTQAGQAYNPGTHQGLMYLDSTSELADVRVTVPRTSEDFGLVFRYSEDDTHYRFGRISNEDHYGIEFVGGEGLPVPVTELAAVAPADGDVLEVQQDLDGTIRCLVNGVVTHRLVDTSTNLRWTLYGLSTFGSEARFDDFRVTPK